MAAFLATLSPEDRILIVLLMLTFVVALCVLSYWMGIQWERCCSYAEEIQWCEECDKPKDDCCCVNGRAFGLSLTSDNPFNGRFVVIDKLEDPGWVELGVTDPRKISALRLAVHESEIIE